MSSYSITDETHLTTLNNQLKDNLFIGGHQPNAEDALVFEQFVQASTEPNQEKYVNLWSWFALVILFETPIRESWKQQVVAQKVAEKKKEAPAKKEEPKVEAKKEEVDSLLGDKKEEVDSLLGDKKDDVDSLLGDKKASPLVAKKDEKDECDDLFGDDEEVDVAALEELKKKKEIEQQKKKDAKPKVIAKSFVVLEVKVWDPEQNLDELAARILKVEKDGLAWKSEYKLADVAFGVKKIVIGLIVEDEKVSVDDIIDELQEWEDDIQSVDIVSFNKL